MRLHAPDAVAIAGFVEPETLTTLVAMQRPLVLIDLETREGIVGRSYVRCYSSLALQATARLLRDLEELIVDAVADPRRLQAQLERRFRLLGTQGLVGIALAGIEMAAWDACARAQQIPLVRLLGGEPRAITAYPSLRTMDPSAAAEEALGVVARGFGGVKLKVGGRDLARDMLGSPLRHARRFSSARTGGVRTTWRRASELAHRTTSPST